MFIIILDLVVRIQATVPHTEGNRQSIQKQKDDIVRHPGVEIETETDLPKVINIQEIILGIEKDVNKNLEGQDLNRRVTKSRGDLLREKNLLADLVVLNQLPNPSLLKKSKPFQKVSVLTFNLNLYLIPSLVSNLNIKLFQTIFLSHRTLRNLFWRKLTARDSPQNNLTPRHKIKNQNQNLSLSISLPIRFTFHQYRQSSNRIAYFTHL